MYRQVRIGIALGVLLLGVFLIPMGIAPAGVAKALVHQFEDIDSHPWGADVMREMVDLGILEGYPRQLTDTYGNPDTKYFAEPEWAITRAEFATLLARSLGLMEGSGGRPFADQGYIPDWALGSVTALYDLGIVKGSPGSNGGLYFQPLQEITRAEIAVMVVRALEGNDITRNGSEKYIGNPFRDVYPGDWYYPDILAAFDLGIVSGRTDTSFAPEMNAKRVEVMTILLRMLEEDQSSSPTDQELKDLVTNYYIRAENFLQGKGKKGLQGLLTGGAACSFDAGGLGFLESSPLPDYIDVGIAIDDSGPRVISKSGRLAKVTCHTVIYMESHNENIPSLKKSVQEKFGLMRTGSGWKIYSVEISG